jgi:phosphoribosyl-ATP pyrophosphohydrolase
LTAGSIRAKRRIMQDMLSRLETTIAQRRAADPSTSYVAKISAKGRAKLAQKLGEEAVETVIAAMQGDKVAVVSESADLLFHWLLLLADCGISLVDVAAELERREGISGIAEKAARPTE